MRMAAGTAVITTDQALLWTDGRYFLQARLGKGALGGGADQAQSAILCWRRVRGKDECNQPTAPRRLALLNRRSRSWVLDGR